MTEVMFISQDAINELIWWSYSVDTAFNVTVHLMYASMLMQATMLGDGREDGSMLSISWRMSVRL
jgi:hypothetical protein